MVRKIHEFPSADRQAEQASDTVTDRLRDPRTPEGRALFERSLHQAAFPENAFSGDEPVHGGHAGNDPSTQAGREVFDAGLERAVRPDVEDPFSHSHRSA